MPLSSDPVLPAWFVLPLALLATVIVGAHLMLLQTGSVPPSRRRIRTANGVVTLIVIPLIAYLFGIVAPNEKREFLLASSASVGLLFIILLLAGVDILNSLRLHAGERRARRQQLQRLRGELRQIVRDADHRLAIEGDGHDAGASLRFRPDDAGDDRDT